VTFALNPRLNFPKYSGVSRFKIKVPVCLQKTFDLYPMFYVLGEDDGLGKCMEPARVLNESDSLSALVQSQY
jgi:hypothetical protein